MKAQSDGADSPTANGTERLDRTQKLNMSRRKFAMTTGVTIASVAGLSTGAAAKVSDELNFGSGLVQDPVKEDTVTITEVVREDGMADLDYLDDSGEPASLEDNGGRLAERDDDDEEHNPVTLRADRFNTSEYLEFPRGETYEVDDEDESLNWVDDQHWTAESEIALVTETGPSGADALRVSSDGVAEGASATATFSDVDIDRAARAYLQLVVNVDELPADAVAYVRVSDSGGESVEAAIDPSGDHDYLIADALGQGIVFQKQVGEFDGGDALENIAEVEIEIQDADVDILFTGMNLDRTSRWGFGTREYVDEDADLQTETVRRPSGEYQITSLETLDDTFDDATIMNVTFDVEFPLSELPEDAVDFDFEDLERSTYDQEFQMVATWDLPTGYDLTYDNATITDEVLLGGGPYNTVDVETDVDEVLELDDVDDESWTDRTADYDNEGDEVELSAAASSEEKTAVYFEYEVWDDDVDEMTDVAAAVGPTGTRDGGILSYVFSLPGMAITALGSVWGVRKIMNR